MNDQFIQKGNRITQQIILGILLLAFGGFLVQGISEWQRGKKIAAAKTATLPELLLRSNKSGEVVKLQDYAIDMKHRINALPESGVKEDVHIMVPLRPIGQDEDEDVVALFVLEEDAYNCVEDALDAWKDSLINLRAGEDIYVELLALDELPGNVPKVVRGNNRVAKKVLVFREVEYNEGEIAFLIIAGLMGLTAFFVYRRSQKIKEREQFSGL